MKQCIVMNGRPGSGKTTLSKYLALNSDFFHFEYDEYLKNKENFFRNKSSNYYNIIVDGLFLNERNLKINLNSNIEKGYKVTVINLNTDKELCKNNILKRGRPTTNLECEKIDLEKIWFEYNYIFDIVMVDNYKIIKLNCSEQIKDILFNYFN